jgi:tRNA A37 threonylcarbamoyltransferase TsaD
VVVVITVVEETVDDVVGTVVDDVAKIVDVVGEGVVTVV